MFPGKLTPDQMNEYMSLNRRITDFVTYVEATNAQNKKLKPDQRQPVDYSKNLSNEEYYRWNELRTIGWS